MYGRTRGLWHVTWRDREYYVRLRPQVPTPTFQKMPRARPSGPRVSVILKKGRQPGRHARFLGSELGRQNDVSGSAKSQSVHDLQ